MADGKASKTLESYVGDIRAFLQWLESKGNSFTGNIKRFHITSYRNYIVQEGYEVNTINKKINSLQSFIVEVFTDIDVEKLPFRLPPVSTSTLHKRIRGRQWSCCRSCRCSYY